MSSMDLFSKPFLLRLGGRATVALLVLAAAYAALAAPPPVEQDGYKIEWTAVGWEGSVHLPGDRMGWEATLSGLLSGPPDKEVAAYVVEMEEVLDARGRSLLPTPFEKRWTDDRQQRRREEQVHRVFGRRGEDGGLGGFSVPLGVGEEPISRIAKARGAVYVMEVTESKTLDIPLGAGPHAWHELGEGVKFRVQSVETRGNQLLIHIAHSLGEEVAGEDLLNPPYVFSVTTLDASGKPEAPPAGFSNPGEGELIVTVFSATQQPAQPAALRLRLATAIEERKIAFELTDLDLGLGPGEKE